MPPHIMPDRAMPRPLAPFLASERPMPPRINASVPQYERGEQEAQDPQNQRSDGVAVACTASRSVRLGLLLGLQAEQRSQFRVHRLAPTGHSVGKHHAARADASAPNVFFDHGARNGPAFFRSRLVIPLARIFLLRRLGLCALCRCIRVESLPAYRTETAVVRNGFSTKTTKHFASPYCRNGSFLETIIMHMATKFTFFIHISLFLYK